MIDTTKPISAVKYNGQELPMQGAVITDGVVVKARDADGFPTEVDYYGDTVCGQGLGSPNGSIGIGAKLTKVTFHDIKRVNTEAFYNATKLAATVGLFDTIEYIGTSAFHNCVSFAVDVILPSGVVYGNFPFQYSGITGLATNSDTAISAAFVLGCVNLLHFSALKATVIHDRALEDCTNLTSVNIGSAGHGVTSIDSTAFKNDSQSGLTITIHTNGSYADTLLSRIRNGATNATIILKAAEDTTYNDVAFAAGDTIITSTVEATES